MGDEVMKRQIVACNPPGLWNDQIARAVAWRMAMPGATFFDLVHTCASFRDRRALHPLHTNDFAIYGVLLHVEHDGRWWRVTVGATLL
jgi:hypothetical protein